MHFAIALALLSAFAVARFWRALLFLVLGTVAFLMALGMMTLANTILH